ncbi:Uncharacterized protein HZ326_26932 [Fusarium oxysporum f. sp. albedinis]|nr:Uncharacterized protein HZ326_26932 [Fusarium oxysporum f. sp. albedinis]
MRGVKVGIFTSRRIWRAIRLTRRLLIRFRISEGSHVVSPVAAFDSVVPGLVPVLSIYYSLGHVTAKKFSAKGLPNWSAMLTPVGVVPVCESSPSSSSSSSVSESSLEGTKLAASLDSPRAESASLSHSDIVTARKPGRVKL